jgi:hypothetical protein
VNANHLGGVRRVHGEDLAGGLDALAADDDVVLAAELAPDIVERGQHAPLVFRLGEVDERLIDEGS